MKGVGMAVNLKLSDVSTVEPGQDRWGRTWVGWSPDLPDEVVYEQNRGIWVLGRRALTEDLATFSHDGAVVAVIALDGIEDVPPLPGQLVKQAIRGRVLRAGDADYDALIGQSVDHHRNPVTYLEAARRCGCGCGGEVTGNRMFRAGHDQRAIHSRIAQQWGTTLQFIDWFDRTYGTSSAEKSSAAPDR
jgi:hypothetical protein